MKMSTLAEAFGLLDEARVTQDDSAGAPVYRAWVRQKTTYSKNIDGSYKDSDISFIMPFSATGDVLLTPADTDPNTFLRSPKVSEGEGTVGDSFLVDTTRNVIDLDVSANRYMIRRPNKGGTKTFTIPHSGASFGGNTITLQKTLKAVMVYDSRVTGDFKIIGNPTHRGQTVDDLLGKKRTGDIATNGGQHIPITLYHGTSAKRADMILKQGLMPGKVPEVYGDLIPGYSEHNLYLSTSVSEAENYASRAAIDDRSRAVVLKVTVRDLDKLILDEDSMNWMVTVDPEGNDVEIHFKHSFWKEWPHAPKIMAKWMKGIAKILNQRGNIAYKGRIPAHDISVDSTYKPASMKREPTWGEFNDAQVKTMSTYSTELGLDGKPPKKPKT